MQTPLDALFQLARSVGAAGKKFTDLTFSDEYVSAVESVESEGRYDHGAREGVESAFCEGRREWRLAGGWKTAWTTASVDYDKFGTETVEGPFEWEGQQLRRVVIDPLNFSWQTARYPNGWDEDPRVAEARIKETLAREQAEREARERRRADGLIWIRTADIDGDDDAADELARANGLAWEDVRAERRRRRDEKTAAERAAKWAECRAMFKDGDTLIDAGTEGYRGFYGWVSGHESKAHIRCKVRPSYSCEDDAELAAVHEGDGPSTVGTLAAVAAMFASGRMRIAGPEDIIPPRAVTDRLRVSWKDVLRVDVNGRVVWIGRGYASSQQLVLDDDGHIVRAKKIVDAAEGVYREHYFGGPTKRSFKLFACDHARSRAVRFARDGVDLSALKVVLVCVACGAYHVSGERKWHDAGCLELNVGGPRDGYQDGDRADLLDNGNPMKR